MISIVVCSTKEQTFIQFSENVQSTIGVHYEIIRIENKENKYSLCAAYNKGTTLCKYDLICFAHEDISFSTPDWGQILTGILKEKEIGLVGVLGACYLSLFPADWVDANEVEGQIIEGYKPDNSILRLSRFPGSSIAEVVATDGVFMATRKDVMRNFNFSDDILTGFHGYDFDISMQIRQQFKVVVTRDILLKHASNGNFNNSYFEAIKKLSQKWKKLLPVYVSSYSKTEIKNLKVKSLFLYCKKHEDRRLFSRTNLIAIGYAARHGVLFSWALKLLRGYRGM